MSAEIAGSKVGRGRRTLGQLWQVPTFAVGLTVLLLVAASSPWRHSPQWWEFEETIASLRRGLETNQEPGILVGLAEKALVKVHLFADRSAEVHLLAGNAYSRQAAQCPPVQAAEIWPRAADQYDQALSLGIDDRELPALHYRLGVALLKQNRDVPRAIELMTKSIDAGSEQPLAGYQLLLQAHLDLKTPNVDAALAASAHVLELTDEQDIDGLARARIQHCELLLRKDARIDALKELELVGPRASAPLRLKARLLMTRCCEEEGFWTRASVLWKELLPEAAKIPGGKARVYYALGLCCHQAEPPRDVDAAEAWAEALKIGGPEGQAAGLRLGELALQGMVPDFAQAVDAWGRALASVQALKDFANPYLTLDQARAFFDFALRLTRDRHDPVAGQQLAALYRKVALPGVAEEKLGHTYEAHGKLLQAKTEHKGEGPAPEAAAEFVRAAEAYDLAAVAGTDTRRAENLWRSARCYLAGQEPARAAVVLDRYVQLDRDEKKLAEAWFSLGEAFRTQAKRDFAREAYRKCIEYPGTPFASRSRYQLAADVLAAKDVGPKEFEHARDILEQNLAGSTVLDREAHEKSLYKQAWVLMQLQDFDRAALCLKQASSQYPNNPSALVSRDQLGECYHRLAEQARAKAVEVEKAGQVDLSEEKRAGLQEQLRFFRKSQGEWLEAAARTYQGLADDLENRGRTQKDQPEMEVTLLRRALFNVAENRFDLGDYAEALRQYRVLLQRYRGKIEGLIACERIWRLVGVMTQTAEQAQQARNAAGEAIQIAEEDLRRMNPDGEDFHGQGVWTRQEWQRWLAYVRGQLNAAPAPKGPAIQ